MRTLRTAAIVLGLLVPAAAMAQVANPLPQSIGMGGNYTALARGLGAPAWNPAGLGMPDNPGASFSFFPLAFTAGLSPITPADLADYGGELIPASVRADWLNTITEEGGERGTLGADVTYLALSVGRLALSASSSIRSRVNMAPDVAEVFFFGNAGLTGTPRDLTLEGSNFDVAGTTTFAASLALPLSLTLGPLPDQHFSVGATVKYTVGNFLVLGQENESTLSSNPIAVDVNFPMIHTPFPDSADEDQTFMDVVNNGTGYGVDVGAAWQGGIFSAGVVVKNLVNTFEWDLENLRFREGSATWNTDTSTVSFDTASIENAPAELVDRIESLYTFAPVLQAGAAARILPFLTVTGELRHAVDDNLDVGTRNHVGVGAELTLIPILPLRAGVAAISGGYQLSGGVGLKLGPMQLSVSGAARETDLGADAIGAVGLTFGVR
jgi:hypothetical protein